MLAPGVEGVVDEQGPLEQHLVVGLDVEAAQSDRQQARPGRVGVVVGVNVGGVDDAGQPDQGRVAAQLVVVDEDLEGAEAGAVVVLGAGGVEGVGAVAGGDGQDVVGGERRGSRRPGR